MTYILDIEDIDHMENMRLMDGLPNNEPFYVMIAGGMSAGKSFIINKFVESIDIFDIDETMEELGFRDYTSEQFSVAMDVISEKIDIQFKERESMIAMGTASNPTIAIDRLFAAKMNGYQTILVHIDTPVNQSILQNKQRLDNGQRGVKKSDEHKIERTTTGAAQTVSFLRESALVDFFIYFNNYRVLNK